MDRIIYVVYGRYLYTPGIQVWWCMNGKNIKEL